jgi:hypothetical protein
MASNAAIDEILAAIKSEMERTYATTFSASDILELDSSSEAKWSRHCVIRMPGAAFVDNIQAGNFIKQATAALRQELSAVIDFSIYTSNRCFRCPYSTKYGKHEAFLPTHRYMAAGAAQNQVFMASLVTNTSSAVRLLSCAGSAAAPHRTPPSTCTQLRAGSQVAGRQPAAVLPAAIAAYLISITSAAAANLPCHVRSVHALLNGKLAVDMDGPASRFCCIAGRTHKSNNIYYIVDVTRLTYRLACGDAHCCTVQPWQRLPM